MRISLEVWRRNSRSVGLQEDVHRVAVEFNGNCIIGQTVVLKQLKERKKKRTLRHREIHRWSLSLVPSSCCMSALRFPVIPAASAGQPISLTHGNIREMRLECPS